MNMIGITAYYPAENATVPTRTECNKIADARQQIDAVHELVVDGVYCVDGSNDTSNVLPMHNLHRQQKCKYNRYTDSSRCMIGV